MQSSTLWYLYIHGRVSHFEQLPHAFQKDVPEVLKDAKDLSSSTGPHMMTSQPFTCILISTLKKTIHLVLSLFISKTKAVRYQETMDLLLSLQEHMCSQIIKEAGGEDAGRDRAQHSIIHLCRDTSDSTLESSVRAWVEY